MFCFFFFKQKTAYEMRISDWSSDVCSSDLLPDQLVEPQLVAPQLGAELVGAAPVVAGGPDRLVGLLRVLRLLGVHPRAVGEVVPPELALDHLDRKSVV